MDTVSLLIHKKNEDFFILAVGSNEQLSAIIDKSNDVLGNCSIANISKEDYELYKSNIVKLKELVANC